MGVEVLAGAALALTAVSTVATVRSQQEAAKEGKKSRREQEAMNAARAAQERRQQIREERIRRARILQASENTGVTASSGEAGAVGNLATQLQSNIGFNQGQLRSAGLISDFQQNAQDAMDSASLWQQVGNLSGSIFSAAGGFGAFKGQTQAPAPVSEATIRQI